MSILADPESVIIYLSKGVKKCKAEDCEREVTPPERYCSIECACYCGDFSVTKGWLHESKT